LFAAAAGVPGAFALAAGAGHHDALGLAHAADGCGHIDGAADSGGFSLVAPRSVAKYQTVTPPITIADRRPPTMPRMGSVLDRRTCECTTAGGVGPLIDPGAPIAAELIGTGIGMGAGIVGASEPARGSRATCSSACENSSADT
jgi:hypothetical protein